MIKQMKKLGAAALAVPATALVASPAFADGDFAALTSGISFDEVKVGVLAVAALLAAVYVAIKGARIILGFLRS